MKVLTQNRIDWFTEVQLSALAAFQAEQADGRLSKNLGEEEGEKKKNKVLVGTVWLQLLQMMHTLAHFSWISYSAFGLSCAPSANVTRENPKAHRAETNCIYQWLCHQWHRPGRVTKGCRGLCLEKLILIQFVSSGPPLLFKNPLF